MHRSGAAVTFFQPSYEDYSLENSSYNGVGGILLGEGFDESKAVYRFYFPPPQGGQEVDSLTIFIYGTGDITNFLVGGYTWSTFPDSFSIGFTIDDIRAMLQPAGDSVGGYYLDVEIDVMSGPLGGERYDLEKIEVTYTYSGADNIALKHFHTAYSAYNAINNFKSDIVNGTWGLGAAPTDELIQRAVQKTGAFCQNLLGLDGNIVVATKSFFNALDSFYSLVNLIDQQVDYLLFWGFYPTTGPTLAQIQTACDDAATACANLAIDYQNYGFDGSYSGGEAATILAKIQDVESKLNILKSRLQSAANDMYSDGADAAKVAKQSMEPLMRYDPNSMTLYDSYLPNLIDDVTLQEDQFVTVTIDTSPGDKNLEVNVDSVPYTNSGTFIWQSGSSHTIEAPSPQPGSDAKTYGFTNWSDSGAQSHTINPTSDGTITAYYVTTPISPSSFSHSSVTNDSITWTWQDNSSDEDGFHGQDSSHDLKWTATSNATSYTETGLNANTQYTRHVHAYNWVGDSGPSNNHSAYTAANLPGAGSFSNITTNSIQANWTADGNPAGTEYFCENITQGTNSGWITGTSWVSSGLSSATTYAFQVKARNEDEAPTGTTSLGSQMTHYDPVITAIEPNSGPIGTYMKIEGQYFYDSGSVKFLGDIDAVISDYNDTVIYCRVPPTAVSGDLIVQTTSISNGVNFNITDPTIIYVDHNSTPKIENGTTQYPFSMIGRGVYSATSGDEIMITADTYSEDISCDAGIKLRFTGDSIMDGQVTTGAASDIISDGNLVVTGTTQVGGDVNTATGLTFESIVTADGGTQTFDAGLGTLFAMDAITKTTAGNLTIAGVGGISLAGDVTGIGVTFENAVTATGGGPQTFDASTGTLTASSISKAAAGLTLVGDSGISLANDVTAIGVTFENAVTAVGAGPQRFDAGTGTLFAMSSVTKTTAGDLTLAGDTQIDLDGSVTAADGNLALVDNTVAAPGKTLSAGLDVILADGNGLTGSGSLTIEAANHITLGGEIETAGDFILIADSDANGLGDVEIKDLVTLTAGSFTSSGIEFDNPNSPVLTAGGNITVNHTGLVTLGADLNPNGGTVSGTATKVIVTPTGKIQDGIDVSSPVEIGDVMVMNGTYTGEDNRDIDFKGKALTLHSENGPETCIIDCQQQQNNGFYFHNNEDANSLLEGFTIRNSAKRGIYNTGSSPKISNCIITNNSPGIYISGGNLDISNCVIAGNFFYNGGGITCENSNFKITNCLISGNHSYSIGGFYPDGGGIFCRFNLSSGNGTITNCTIVNNIADGFGGAIACRGGSFNLCVANSLLWENSASLGSSIYLGGGFPRAPSVLTIYHSNLQNGQDGIQLMPDWTVNWGDGNIDVDPLFVNEGYWDFGDWVNGDYHLQADSLCIDTGDPNYVTNANDTDIDGNRRVFGGRIDMGAYEYQPERILDFDNDGIVNFADFAMLAYYWADYECVWPDWCEGCDADESGMVNHNDLFTFSEHWLAEYPVVFYSEPLDANPHWSTTGEWSFGQPTGGGGTQYGNPDPTSGYTGTNVYGVNLNGDYSIAVGGPYYLTAGPFDCNSFSNVKLKFARWLNTDDPAYVTATIEVSDDGATWTMVWENGRGEITDTSWRKRGYDISSVADDQETVYIRWGYDVLEYAYPYSGWNIDDIELWGNP